MVTNTRVFKYITEIMQDIASDNENVQKYLNNTTLRAVFEYCYDPVKKFALPEGNPPYRTAPEPIGMTPTNFLQTVRIWPNFSRIDLKPAKREAIFINTLEGIHESEALLLLAIKNGNIDALYPFATKSFGVDHGFLSKSLIVEEVTIPKKHRATRITKEPESPKA